MKLIVSSDGMKAVNAENVGEFYVMKVEGTEQYYISADGTLLSMYNKEKKAIDALKNLLASLAQDNIPFLYYMEDGIE